MTRQEFIDLALAELSRLRILPQSDPAVDVAIAWADTLRAHRADVAEFRVPSTLRDTRQVFDRAAWAAIIAEQPMLLRRQAQ